MNARPMFFEKSIKNSEAIRNRVRELREAIANERREKQCDRSELEDEFEGREKKRDSKLENE